MIDTKAIRASARRIIELAKAMPTKYHHDLVAEAAAILKLTEREQ